MHVCRELTSARNVSDVQSRSCETDEKPRKTSQVHSMHEMPMFAFESGSHANPAADKVTSSAAPAWAHTDTHTHRA